MKQISITLYENGKSTIALKELNFNSENLATIVTIDYSNTDQAAWTKRANIVMSADGTGAIFNGDQEAIQTINITNAMAKEGTMTIYPYAVQIVGQTEYRTIWSAQAVTIGPFADLLHDDSTVTPSIAEQLQVQIDIANAEIDTKMDLDGTNSDVNILSFNTENSPVVQAGQIAYNADQRSFVAGSGNNVELTIGGETHYPDTISSDTETIPNGALVQFDGSIGNSGVTKVKRCTIDVALAGAIMGVATEDIPAGQPGKVTWFGKVRGIQTDGANYGETWADGEILYNSGTIPGGLSKTKPVAPKNAAFVGIVVNAHASNGQLLIRPMFFPRLEQLSNLKISNPDHGDFLTYNFALGVWENTGPTWDDLQFELTPTRVGANNKPDFDYTNIGLLFPRNDPSEIVYITVQFPHTWKEGTDIHPHVHCRQSFNQQAVFKMAYIWYNLGDPIPTSWTTLIMNTPSFAYTSGNIAQIISGATISGAGKKISSILKLKLYRDDNVYTGDMLVDQFDIHIQIDATGSTTEFAK